MHTFCKSCIVKYFRTATWCPTCGIDMPGPPYESLRRDGQFQSIVYKLVPGLQESEAVRVAAFYASRRTA